MCIIGGDADYAQVAAKLRSSETCLRENGGYRGFATCQAAECNNTRPACKYVLRYHEAHGATVEICRYSLWIHGIVWLSFSR